MDAHRSDDAADPPRPESEKQPGRARPIGRPKGAGPIRPGRHGAPRSPGELAASAADSATDRLAVFAHELASLVDGTMRYVSLARAGLDGAAAAGTAAAAAQQLAAATHALERMAGLVAAAMRPHAGTFADDLASPRSLREAVDHAVEALKPLADHRGVSVSARCAEAVAHSQAGPLFTVVSNGLRNAIEACGAGGAVRLEAVVVPDPVAPTGASAHIDIIDDGVGPPEGDKADVFRAGFTTKQGSAGLGLALAKEIVAQLGGVISLEARMDGRRRNGAHLRVRCPVSMAQ